EYRGALTLNLALPPACGSPPQRAVSTCSYVNWSSCGVLEWCWLAVGEVGVEASEDLVGDPPFERSDCRPFGVAPLDAAFDVVVARSLAAPLGDSDPVDGGVDLAVPSSAETKARVGSPDRNRSCPVPAGVGGT